MRHSVLLSAIAAGCVAAVIFAGGGGAQDGSEPCNAFSWSLETERTWFTDANLQLVRSGETLSNFSAGAMRVEQAIVSKVGFVLPPERKAKPGQPYAAVVTYSASLEPGLYQITLSDEAWIDVIQNNTYVKSGEHTGVKGCKSLRKSVRFNLKAEPLTIQLSSAAAPALKLAIAKVEKTSSLQ